MKGKLLTVCSRGQDFTFQKNKASGTSRVVLVRTSCIVYKSPSGFHYRLCLYLFLTFPLNFIFSHSFLVLFPHSSLSPLPLSLPSHPPSPPPPPPGFSLGFFHSPSYSFHSIPNTECKPVKLTFQLNFQALSIWMGLNRGNATKPSLLQTWYKMVASGPAGQFPPEQGAQEIMKLTFGFCYLLIFVLYNKIRKELP